MIVRARDLEQYGMKTINRKQYPIKTMTIYGKGDIATAKSSGVDDKGNPMFSYKTDEDGNTYALFGDIIIGQGAVYVNETADADPKAYLFCEDDVGTTNEWQAI